MDSVNTGVVVHCCSRSNSGCPEESEAAPSLINGERRTFKIVIQFLHKKVLVFTYNKKIRSAL